MRTPIYIEPAQSERKYRRLKALSQELRIPVMEMFLEVEVRDGAGRVTDHFKQRSHSWTRNAYNILISQFGSLNAADTTFAAGKISAKDTSGTVQHASSSFNVGQGNLVASGVGYTGASGSNTYGIQYGNNTEADDFEAFALTGLIANGTSSGNLSYAVGQPIVASYDTPSKTWTVTVVRFANNNTGNTTSVNEIGLVANCFVAATTNNACMLSRDHLSSTISVLDTGQIKAIYTLTLTFPG